MVKSGVQNTAIQIHSNLIVELPALFGNKMKQTHNSTNIQPTLRRELARVQFGSHQFWISPSVHYQFSAETT